MKNKEDNRTLDWIIKIILIIIIIFLLIHNCTLLKKNREYENTKPGDNVDVIEIKCENNVCKPIPKEIESLSFAQDEVSVKIGESINLIVTIKPSELSSSKLIWKSSNSKIVSVDENGKIKGLASGKAVITVTSSNGKEATCQVEVVKDEVNVKKIRLVPNRSSIDVGKMTQIVALIEPKNATNRDLVWTSSDTKIATVDSKGFVKGLKEGTVTITAKTKDGKVIANVTIKIKPKEMPKQIESLSFSQDNVSVKKGDTQKLIVTIKPSELSSSKLTWESSDKNIVTVDSNGNIKGINVGKATITVTSSNGKKATCTVNVTTDEVKVDEIILTPTESTITEGNTAQIIAEIKPENATNRDLVWESSNPAVATVDSKGYLKGIKEGTVTITAKTKDGKVVATTKVTINSKPTPQVESIEFSQDNVSVKKGDTQKLIVTIKPSELSSSKLTWESSDKNIVTVDSNGNIKGINVGKATITVTSSNGKKATCTVNVTTDEIKVDEIILTPTESTITEGDTAQIIAEIRPENATNRDLVWESSDPTVATVDSKGFVKGLKNGVVTITAKTKDGKVVASVELTIEKEIEEFSVYDNEHTSLTWNGSNDLKIFSKSSNTMDGKIAPESSSTYQFDVKNSTKFNLKYQIKFIETNEYGINMQYKLKKNDTYIIDHYVKANELNVSDVLLNSKETDIYCLEWKWISSNNDTNIGKNPDAKYGLKIEIVAEGANG